MKKKGTSLCLYSPKGGVGKTILAMNLAGVASLNNKKVLLIDLDLFNGGLSLLTNEPIINKNIFKISDDMDNNRFNDLNNYLVHYSKFIDIIPSPKDPRDAVKINAKNISSLIDMVEHMYDLVIIDTASYLDKINLNTLNEADHILIVMTNDLMSIKNVKNIIAIFNDTNVSNFNVLLNESVDNIDTYFDHKDIKRIINANIDYKIDKSFFIKELTSYIYGRKIPVLSSNIKANYKKEITKLQNIINDVIGDDINE